LSNFRTCHLPSESESLNNSPFFPLFLEKEDLFSGIVILFLSFFHFQVKLLGDRRGFSIELDGSIPVGIGDPIEGFEISLDPLLKSGKVLFLVLIGRGDAREIKGEVFGLEGLLSSIQDLIDFLFFGNLAG
jgi:hypothetical protein